MEQKVLEAGDWLWLHLTETHQVGEEEVLSNWRFLIVNGKEQNKGRPGWVIMCDLERLR